MVIDICFSSGATRKFKVPADKREDLIAARRERGIFVFIHGSAVTTIDFARIPVATLTES